MVPHKANRRRNYGPSRVEIVAAFMMSPRGYYNGNAELAALGALDNARDYPITSPDRARWIAVHDLLILSTLNAKGKEN